MHLSVLFSSSNARHLKTAVIDALLSCKTHRLLMIMRSFLALSQPRLILRNLMIPIVIGTIGYSGVLLNLVLVI